MTKANKPEINGCRFLKNGVKDAAGNYYPCWYSRGALINGSVAITLYARCILKGLPAALRPAKRYRHYNRLL